MRLVVLVCLCLCMVPLVLAAPDVIFDKIISHGTTISLNDSSYTVQIGSSNNSLIKLVSSFETLLVEPGDCIDKMYSTFCYISYDKDQKINANLTDYRPFIDVDRSISSKSLDLGERTTITIIFENTGGESVDDFLFIENIPSMLTIINASGCSISDDNSQRIEFEEELPADIPKVCEYVLEAGDVGLGVYEGKLYTDSLVGSKDAKAIPQVAITAKNVFNLDITSSKYDLDVGQPFVLTFSIENIETGSGGDNLTIHNITLDIEELFLTKKIFDSELYSFSNSRKVLFSGKLLPEEIFEQKIELESLILKENISVDIYVYYQLGTDAIKSFKRVIPLTQLFHPLYCEYVVVDDSGNNLISLDKLNHELPGYDRGELFVYVYNDNPYISLSNLRYLDSGDINFPSSTGSGALRKNSKEILTSKLFSFDKLDKFQIASGMKIKYSALNEKLESSCDGDISVNKPSFLKYEKELFFVNITVDENQEKLLPVVRVKIFNDFFLPISNVQLTEILPVAVFSNNNTKKEFSLDTIETALFEYNFIVPDDYVTINDSNLILETIISYDVFGNLFTDSVFLTVNTNDVISAQKGMVLENIIDTKIEQLTLKINKSLIDSQNISVVNGTTIAPTTIYDPFLDYFAFSIIIFLFFLAFIFLNIRYSLVSLINKWFVKLRVEKLAKKEKSFANKYAEYKFREKDYALKLAKGVKLLKSLKSAYITQQKKFKKAVKNIKSKELLVSATLKKEQHSIENLSHKKILIEKEIATLNSLITSQEGKKQTLGVEKSNQKLLLENKKKDILKTEDFIAHLKNKINSLDESLENMTSDFESSYSKNKSILDFKLKKVRGDLSHLDEDYAFKRKILKEEEEHLEQNE